MADFLETTIDDSFVALVEYDSDEMSSLVNEAEQMQVQAEVHERHNIESIEDSDIGDVRGENQQEIKRLEKSKSKRFIIFCWFFIISAIVIESILLNFVICMSAVKF